MPAKTYKLSSALKSIPPRRRGSAARRDKNLTPGRFPPSWYWEANREFASKYGLKAEYWATFKREESRKYVLRQTNLKTIATLSRIHARIRTKRRQLESS